VLCDRLEVLTLLRLGDARRPSYATLKGLELDPQELATLKKLFKAEVAKPTIAVAHPISRGVGCKFFPATKEGFLIPPTEWGDKLREWKNTASAKSKAKPQSTEKP
jgi:hypothetical protein